MYGLGAIYLVFGRAFIVVAGRLARASPRQSPNYLL